MAVAQVKSDNSSARLLSLGAGAICCFIAVGRIVRKDVLVGDHVPDIGTDRSTAATICHLWFPGSGVIRGSKDTRERYASIVKVGNRYEAGALLLISGGRLLGRLLGGLFRLLLCLGFRQVLLLAPGIEGLEVCIRFLACSSAARVQVVAVGGLMALSIAVSAPAVSRFKALQLPEVGLDVYILRGLIAAWGPCYPSSNHSIVRFNDYGFIFDLFTDLQEISLFNSRRG